MQYEPIENTPLASNDQAKLLIFALLFAPSIVFIGGIIPAIFLAFGIYMMKKNQDFSHIEVAYKNFRKLTLGVALFGLGWSILESLKSYNSHWDDVLFAIAIPSYVYFVLINHLFYKPLKSRYMWVEKNDIFSAIRTQDKKPSSAAELDIIKGERLKQYSVADELLKWAKLKEDGHISEQEFNEARAKLLKK